MTWTQETRDCSFNELSIDARKTMNSMYRALIEGEDKGFGGDNSLARFQRQLIIVTRTGKFERPPVLFPIASGLSPLDGNHRIFAHHIALQMSDEDLAKYKVQRPAASQSVWIAPTKTAKTRDKRPMCNLYSITTNQAAISALFRVVNRYVGNLAPMAGVFPDYKAPIVRNGAEGRELATARWGMPSSSKALMDATKRRAEKLQAKGKPVDFKELLRMEPDGGTTNIRNVTSKHWTRWLGVENRCVVPFNSFSEFNKAEGGDIWFALDESRPLACFAGIWTNWTSVRKVKEGETTNDLYAFLTTEPNAEVGAIHPKAMPVILTTPDEVETWMTASSDEALKLQRPLADGALRIVARGVKEDPEGSLGAA